MNIMLLLIFLFPLYLCCVHDQIGKGYKLLVLNDTDQVHQRRILQQTSKPIIGKSLVPYLV